MKCPHCSGEWSVPSGLESSMKYCPICGKALTTVRKIPDNAVCRPEDYRFTTAILQNYNTTLEEYTGSDRVIAIPQGIRGIYDKAFSNCGVREVYLPDGVNSIGFSAFEGCHLLTRISLPDSLNAIASGAFEGCFSLEEIEIPGGVREIWPRTFFFCTSLRHVRLCEGIRRIGAEAFGMCIGLKKIEIPDSLEEIHPNAIHCSKDIQVIASEDWKKAHPDLLSRFYYIHGD